MDALCAEFARTRAQFEAAFAARRQHERALVAEAFGPFVADSDVRPFEVDELAARALRTSDAVAVLERFGYRRVGRRMVYWVESTTPCAEIDLDASLCASTLPRALVNHLLATHLVRAPQRHGTKRACDQAHNGRDALHVLERRDAHRCRAAP